MLGVDTNNSISILFIRDVFNGNKSPVQTPGLVTNGKTQFYWDRCAQPDLETKLVLEKVPSEGS